MLSVYRFLFHRTAHLSYTASWRELQRARREASEISAQDEFARWARQQRKLEQLQTSFDRLCGKRQRAVAAGQMGVSLALRVVFYLATFWRFGLRAPNVSVLDAGDTFGPLGRLLALPNLSPGSVSAPAFLLLASIAISHLASLRSKPCS